ncbi:MAG: hypothetical protein AAFY56_20535 [Pseudomonadota bacterium]
MEKRSCNFYGYPEPAEKTEPNLFFKRTVTVDELNLAEVGVGTAHRPIGRAQKYVFAAKLHTWDNIFARIPWDEQPILNRRRR